METMVRPPHIRKDHPPGEGKGNAGFPFASPNRLRLHIDGVVQGVGFRPFVHRLANELALVGSVWNGADGVHIEVEGSETALNAFVHRLKKEAPPFARIRNIREESLPPKGESEFLIVSSVQGENTTQIPPDIATCPDCLAEVFDPANRRFRYPFTNCTHCGPRYSIIRELPYDRCRTTMSRFRMCEECMAEYEDPSDRRFHAQPNACPKCGPALAYWSREGKLLAEREEALERAENAIRQGRIVAVKGLGGFHLMVDARNAEAVRRLRTRKRREEKPFAVMVPDLESVREYCSLGSIEKGLLNSAQAPIVLLSRQEKRLPSDSPAFEEIAPRNPTLGVFLPYTPLHHLLLRDLGFPVVATSGNLSDEPICIDEEEAVSRLRGIADGFLVHDRPIVRQVDDSIVRVVGGREMLLRRSRGYAPLPLPIGHSVPPTLALGAHFKNTVAAADGTLVYLSQHVGDLETEASYRAFLKTVETFRQLRGFEPRQVSHDLHPDYLSTIHARSLGIRCRPVQHHRAHILSCMADNEVEAPLLGVAWDGTGLGTDGTIWGGEFFRVDCRGEFCRVAHLRPFPLPGGDRAAREPRRSALGLLSIADRIPESLWSDLPFVESFGSSERSILRDMLRRRLNSPLTSSMGRLFDAVAAIVGIRMISRFEGQAAMELEHLIGENPSCGSYPVELSWNREHQAWMIDWEPMIRAILEEVRRGEKVSKISLRFHNTLVEMAVEVAIEIAEEKVLLSGGCFQNRYLTEQLILRLREEGFQPFWHRRVPPNDGGIALGQILAVAAKERDEPCV